MTTRYASSDGLVHRIDPIDEGLLPDEPVVLLLCRWVPQPLYIYCSKTDLVPTEVDLTCMACVVAVARRRIDE